MQLRFPGRREGLSHQLAREWISSYLDSQLPLGQVAELEGHLRLCERCQEELQALRMTRQLVRAMPAVRLPRSFALQVAPQRATMPSSFFFLRTATGLATAAFLALFAASMVLPMAGAPMAGVTSSAPSAFQARQEQPPSLPTAHAGLSGQQERLAPPTTDTVGAAAPGDGAKALAPQAAAAPTQVAGAPVPAAPAAAPAAPAAEPATPSGPPAAAVASAPPAPAAPTARAAGPAPSPTPPGAGAAVAPAAPAAGAAAAPPVVPAARAPEAPVAALSAAPEAAAKPTAAAKSASADAVAERQANSATPAPAPTSVPMPTSAAPPSQEQKVETSGAAARPVERTYAPVPEPADQPPPPASYEAAPVGQQGDNTPSLMWLLQAIAGALAAFLAAATGSVWWTHRGRGR